MKKIGYRFLDHTADVSVEIIGRNLEQAFEQTAYSLMYTITPNLNLITPQVEKKITIDAEDKEALLFDFLTEFLYLFDVEGLVFNQINVQQIKKIKNHYFLKAIIKGEKFDKNKHKLGTEVKAITYSFMKIEEKKEEVKINIVFDV